MKRGGQVLAGILGKENFAEVERAMKEFENSAGSADAELTIVQESIQHKLTALKDTWIDYAKELLQRDDIGKILDALINASEKAEGTLDVLAPIIEQTINLIADLIEVIGNIASVTGSTTPFIVAFFAAFHNRSKLSDAKKDLKDFIDLVKSFKDFKGEFKKGFELSYGKEIDVKGFIENFKNAFKGNNVIAETIEEGVENVGDAIADSIQNSAETIKDATSNVVSDAVENSVTDALYEATDKNIELFENTIDDYLDVEDSFEAIHDASEDVSDALENIKGKFDDTNETIDTAKTTVENITEVTEALKGAEEGQVITSKAAQTANEFEAEKSTEAGLANEFEAEKSIEAGLADEAEAAGSGSSGMGGLASLGGKLGSVLGKLASVWPLVAAGIVAATTVAIHWYHSEEQVIKRTEESRKELEKLRDEYHKLAEENSKAAKSLSELIEQYKNAVKGSDEYYKIANQIAEIAPNAVIGHTVDGDAILGDISLLQQELDLLREIAEENRQKEVHKNAELLDAYSGNPITDEGRKYKKNLDETQRNKERAEAYLAVYEEAIRRHEEVRQKLINDAKKENPNITAEELSQVTAAADQELEKYQELKSEILDTIDNYNEQLKAAKDSARKAYEGLMPTEKDISDGKKAMRQMLLDMATEAKLDSNTFSTLFKSADSISDEIWKKLFDLNEKKSSMSPEDYQKNAEQIYQDIIKELQASLPDDTELSEDMKLGIRVYLKIDPNSKANVQQEANKWAEKQGYKKTTKYEGRDLVIGDKSEAAEWYQTLNEEERKIADSDEFTKELEKQKNKFTNVKDACQAAYEAVKKYNEETGETEHKSVKATLEAFKVDEDTTGQEKLDDYYSTLNDIQEVINKINTGDYTAMDLNQWRTEYDLVGESADEMVDELKKVEEESRKAVIEVIDKLIEANPDDSELIKSLEQIKQGIKDIREEAEKKINFNPGIDKLNKFNDGLNALQDSYINFFKEGKQIDTSDLASIREIFGTLDEYQEFENAVLTGNGDLDASFDKLVTAYAKTTNILAEVTEENKQYYITALKNKGIVNAQEVVEKKLTQDKQREVQRTKELANLHATLADTNQNLVNKTKDLENATWQDIAALVAEGEQSGVTSQELALFALKKALAAETNLANRGDIDYLLTLAKAAGVAADSIAELATAKGALDKLQGEYEKAQIAAGGKQTTQVQFLEDQLKKKSQEIQDLGKKIQDDVANFEVEKYDFDFDYDATTAADAAGSAAEATAETFDWIDTKIQRLERDITNLGKTADATFKTWAERTIALGQEIGKVNEQIELQESAYESYMAKAESVGLSAQYKTLVQNGGMRIDEITDDKLKEQIQSYQDWYTKAQDAKDKIDDLRSSLAELAKTKFDNVTTQFEDMLSDIEHVTKFIDAQLKSVETMGKIAGKSFYQAQIAQQQQQANQLTAELAQLQSALNEGLASGAIEYGSQMFNEMKKTIYGVEEQIWDCNNAILEFEQNIKEVAKQNFDDLTSQFENAISILTSKIDLTDKIVSMVESTGHVVSKRYYEAMARGQEQNIKNLKTKYDELSKVFADAVANGDVKEYSDEWYSMKESVESVKGEILDATSALVGYKNAMRQIDWDLFDRGQTRLEQLVSESQFLIDLYGKYPLFDKDTGEITAKGTATRGLYVQNYETYKNQAAELADEIARLKEELKADPANTTLIDRIKELEQSERDALLNMESLKESLRDLREQEINALIDALEKLINKYKESLQQQKD